MAKYKVTLLNPDGSVVEETIEAKDESELFSLFSGRDVILLEYKKDWLLFLREFFFSDLFRRKKYLNKNLLTSVFILVEPLIWESQYLKF